MPDYDFNVIERMFVEFISKAAVALMVLAPGSELRALNMTSMSVGRCLRSLSSRSIQLKKSFMLWECWTPVVVLSPWGKPWFSYL
jgi:hypothetical protein